MAHLNQDHRPVLPLGLQLLESLAVGVTVTHYHFPITIIVGLGGNGVVEQIGKAAPASTLGSSKVRTPWRENALIGRG